MNPFHDLMNSPLISLQKVACIAVVLAGCGQGGNTSATTFASRPITEFGSIIVNGVRFNDSSINQVSSDDDGNSKLHDPGAFTVSMVIGIKPRAISLNDSSRYSTVDEFRFGGQLVGRVGPTITFTVDPHTGKTTGTFTVLGQAVSVDDSTRFDDSIGSGIAGLLPNDIVEVHGTFDAAHELYTATRVETKAATHFKKPRSKA